MYGYLRHNFKFKKVGFEKGFRSGSLKLFIIGLRKVGLHFFRRLRKSEFYMRRKVDKRSILFLFGLVFRITSANRSYYLQENKIKIISRTKNFVVTHVLNVGSPTLIAYSNWDMRQEGYNFHTYKGRKNCKRSILKKENLFKGGYQGIRP